MLAVILAACALPSISHVHTFDDGGRARVMSSGRIAIVKFDPVGCVNCGVVDDFWESAATNFQRSDFTLWRVSCALHRSVCDASNVGISSDPIFDAWTGSGFSRYSGPKDVGQLLPWIFAVGFGMTQLHTAAAEGNTMAVASYISAGADVDARKLDGATPLVMAAQAGHLRAAALLLDAHCNINAANNQGLTALLAATSGGHAEVVAMLLARGASIGVATQESFSLVDVARAERYHDVVDAITSSPGYVPFKSAPLTRPSERP